MARASLHRFDADEFKERFENNERARTRFYKDVDAGHVPDLPRHWGDLAPHTRDFYRSLELRSPTPAPEPSFWSTLWARVPRIGGRS